MAQSVERVIGSDEVTSSILVSSTFKLFEERSSDSLFFSSQTESWYNDISVVQSTFRKGEW